MGGSATAAYARFGDAANRLILSDTAGMLHAPQAHNMGLLSQHLSHSAQCVSAMYAFFTYGAYLLMHFAISSLQNCLL